MCTGMVCLTGMAAYAQKQVTEQQKSEFARGNRDTCFLREYMAALKADNATDEVGPVLDGYLMALPVAQRYTGENVKDFIEYVNRIDARSFVDIIEHWNRVSASDEQKKAVVEKIDFACTMALFNWFADQKSIQNGKRPDLTLIQQSLAKSSMPLSKTKKGLIEMWGFMGKRDVPALIDSMKRLFTGSLQMEMIFDWAVFGHISNCLLDEVNQAQCKEVINIMEKALNDYSDDSTITDVVKREKDNFEGKRMMLEMGEE